MPAIKNLSTRTRRDTERRQRRISQLKDETNLPLGECRYVAH
jgi:hypothetical protein